MDGLRSYYCYCLFILCSLCGTLEAAQGAGTRHNLDQGLSSLLFDIPFVYRVQTNYLRLSRIHLSHYRQLAQARKHFHADRVLQLDNLSGPYPLEHGRVLPSLWNHNNRHPTREGLFQLLVCADTFDFQQLTSHRLIHHLRQARLFQRLDGNLGRDLVRCVMFGLPAHV